MKILFQGDSVTDAGRDRTNPHDMGEGYPRYASAMIQDSFPDVDFEFVNLGIGGDRTEHLVARLEKDFLDIQPDIVSVMIGVNDAWHKFAGIETSDQAFETNMRTVLTALRERTTAKILMIQPLLMYGDPAFREELDRKQTIFARLAEEYADAYLPLDEVFAAQQFEDLTVYSADGVHPSPEGAVFIGEAYLKAITPLIEALTEDED